MGPKWVVSVTSFRVIFFLHWGLLTLEIETFNLKGSNVQDIKNLISYYLVDLTLGRIDIFVAYTRMRVSL